MVFLSPLKRTLLHGGNGPRLAWQLEEMHRLRKPLATAGRPKWRLKEGAACDRRGRPERSCVLRPHLAERGTD